MRRIPWESSGRIPGSEGNHIHRTAVSAGTYPITSRLSGQTTMSGLGGFEMSQNEASLEL